MTTYAAPSVGATSSTRQLLGAGIIAGPVFAVTAAAQVLTRDGFDLRKHPLSLLSNGDYGWVQIANFIVSGAMLIAFAVGVHRVLLDGRGSTWGPRLLAGFGIGMIIAGVFTADPSIGFPIGAPEGMPDTVTVHGILHGVGAVIAFTALPIANFVYARRAFADGQRRWAWVSIVVGIVVFAAPSPGPGLSIRLAVTCAIAFAWVAVLAVRLRRA